MEGFGIRGACADQNGGDSSMELEGEAASCRKTFMLRREAAVRKRQQAKLERQLRKDNLGKSCKVEVAVKTKVTSQLVSGCALALIKHLLFMRQQIPMPYETFRDSVVTAASTEGEVGSGSEERTGGGAGEVRKRGKGSRASRKARKLIGAVDGLLGGVAWLFSNGHHVDCLLVTMGGTPLNPKEAYYLRPEVHPQAAAPPPAHVDDSQMDKEAEKQASVAIRKMIRCVVMGQLEQMDAPIQKGKICVMARVRGAADAHDEAWDTSGWVPRIGMEPRFGRCRPVEVVVGSQLFTEADALDFVGGGPSDAIWMQYGMQGIKGMPSEAAFGGG